MSKLPGFMFYPADWQKDPNLRICSKAAKGLWIDLMCVAFECEERGVFISGDRPWTEQEIAGAVTGDIAENLSVLHELLTKRVARKDNRGAIFNARMVRDEQIRKERSKAGSMGGRPTKYKYLNIVSSKSKTKAKSKQIHEYVDVSENVSEKENKTKKAKFRKSMPENRNGNGHDFSPEFLKFWEKYPKKFDQVEAWEAWVKVLCAPLLTDILSALEWQIFSDLWNEEGGRFIPNPSNYIIKKRWNDKPILKKQSQFKAQPIEDLEINQEELQKAIANVTTEREMVIARKRGKK